MIDLKAILNQVEEIQKKNITCIDFGFKRYRDILPGIYKGASYVILGGVSSGKTAITLDKFVLQPINFTLVNPQIKLHIDYFQLEETEFRHNLRVISTLGYRNLGVEYSIKDFLNLKGNKILLNKTHQFYPLQDAIDKYNECVSTHYNKTPMAIKKALTSSVKSLQEKGFDHNNDDTYHIVVIDNLKFLQCDNGHNSSKKAAIDDLCLNILQEFRQKYGIIPVVLQHETEDNDDFVINVKGDVVENKLKPSLKKLSESRYTADPATHVLGIFTPHRFGIDVYPKLHRDSVGNTIPGYDISKLRDQYRMIKILKGRDGDDGKELSFHFKGAVSSIEELPTIEEFHKNKSLYLNYK
jgi:hypothetical protein